MNLLILIMRVCSEFRSSGATREGIKVADQLWGKKARRFRNVSRAHWRTGKKAALWRGLFPGESLDKSCIVGRYRKGKATPESGRQASGAWGRSAPALFFTWCFDGHYASLITRVKLKSIINEHYADVRRDRLGLISVKRENNELSRWLIFLYGVNWFFF